MDHGTPLTCSRPGPAVDVTDQDEGYAGDGYDAHLQQGQAHGRGDESLRFSPYVSEDRVAGEPDDHDDHDDPAGGRAHIAAHQVEQDPVGDGDDAADGDGEGVEHPDHHALPADVTGQRDDERRQPQAGDERARNEADRRWWR